MTRLFFIINSFSMGGGAEALLTQIVNNLNPQKYEIGIMEIIHGNVKKEPVNNNIKIYPYYTLEDAPDRKARMYYVYHEWNKVIKEYIPQDYDVYISFNYLKPSFLLPEGKKCISWIHGDVYDLLAENKTEERYLQNLAFKKADKIVTISDITTQSVLDLFPEYKDKIIMICNGVDTKKIIKKSEEYTDIKLQHPAILSIGRLDENKNPVRLFNIYKMLNKKMPSVHLYYLGYGKLSDDIERLSNENNLKDKVHLLGYHDNPFPIIKQCDVVGMFSKSEGFPLVLLEAVALGKPFVSSVIGGAKILAGEYNCGEVIEVDEAAVEKFEELLNGDRDNQKKKCAKTIKRFELKEYIKQIEELLDSMI